MIERQRILLVLPGMDLGGAESHVAQLARALKAAKWEVEVASGGGVLAKELEKEGIPHHWVPIRWGYKISTWRLRKVVKNGRFALVHAHSNATGPMVADVCKEFGLPWIYTAHTGIRPPRMECFGEASRILAVSDFNRRMVLDQGADFITPERVVTLHNAIDCDYFTPQGKRAEMRAQWGVEPKDYVIGIVARLLKPERKGHLALLQVLARPEAKNWRLAIIGKYAWWYGGTRKVQKRAEKLGVADRVIWVGHQVDVRPALEGCDVVALPSVAESFGLALAEAMAMKKPVVAYEGSGTNEVIGQKEGGILVPNQDIQALEEALECMESPYYRELMGNFARERIERLYGLPRFMDRLLKIYHEVLKDKNRIWESLHTNPDHK